MVVHMIIVHDESEDDQWVMSCSASNQWFTWQGVARFRKVHWGRGASCTPPVDLITIPFTMKLVTMVVVAIAATAQSKVRLRPCILHCLSGSLHERD